ncbi:MAG: hypothetical protein A2639_01720 [Candidatus Staskawiczbacteria bacterium RIFCSPHIGHO2_01_FULL_34_27]|uniref:Insecticide toxin TcdB middle/N-terminal domain-containing protein n=1 Tax=Candidatus Staskawiczbacteria bacterium RIFCSPHIGHO2_01_FULL_34_27 TaxID=1802199 RepID=A0A1G2HLK4_9BACT|nr:MAG: hypothetical protein A2639_01720 [Candidatus Staskawiczbacteria bacterium RIFCSPHIGHO2_01_FULL_34_27]
MGASTTSSSSSSEVSDSFSTIKQSIPEPDPATGALIYSYPITVPLGRNGMQPDLKLHYNSQSAAQDGIFGYGFEANIPKIERINKHGVNKLYDYKDFRSSLSGELVNISSEDYVAKIENGSFLKYKLIDGVWIITDKKGTLYKFGRFDSSKIYDFSNTDKIYAWYLDEVVDTNGNSIKYFYTKNVADNFLYPDKIVYTGSGAEAGIFSVEFKKEFRPDSYTKNSTGFTQKINERIKSIETYVFGTLSRKYDLIYKIGDNGKRSMLEKIIESGTDGFGVTTTLPSFNFAYTKGDVGLVNTPSINYPMVVEDGASVPFSFADNAVKIIDINGDGLKDIVKSSIIIKDGVDRPVFWVLKNNGSGWVVDNSYLQPMYSFVNSLGNTVNEYFTFSNSIDVGDWNGDGKDDLIKFWVEINGAKDKQHAVVLLNTGTAWVQNTNITTDIPYTQAGSPIYVYSGSYGSQNHFIDLNGDGLIDYINASNYQQNGINYPSFAVLYNDGEDLKWDATMPQPYAKPNLASASEPLALSNSTKILDINGDGLVDFIFANNYQINGIDNPSFWVLINNGHGWDQDLTITQAQYISLDVNDNAKTNYFTSTQGWRVVDINEDSLPDFIMFGTIDTGANTYKKRKTVLVNTGKGWIQDDSLITIGDYTYVDSNGTQTNYPNSGAGDIVLLDINGDGLFDITRPGSYYQSGVFRASNWTLLNNGKIANTLAKIELPQGGSYDFSYKMTSAYKDASGNLLNNNLPSAHNTIKKIIQNDSNGAASTKDYEYSGGRFFYENSFNKRFAGFEKITKINPVGEKFITYYHQGNTTNSTQGEFDDQESKIGMIYRSELYDNSNNIYSKNIQKWDSADLGGGVKFVKLAQTVNFIHDGEATHRDTTESYTYDTYGNTTQKIEYGEVLGNDDGAFLDIGSDKFITNYSYASNGEYIVGFPSQVTVKNQSGEKVKESKFYYDLEAIGSVTKGNLTKQEDWKNGVVYINNQKTYNNYGLVTASIDPSGNATQYGYNSYNLYLAILTNALNQITQYIYDYSSGQVTQKTDINERVFQHTYDGVGRLIEEKQPDLAVPSILVTKATYAYTDTPNAVSVKKSIYLDASNSVDSYIYFDGLARKIQERQEAEGINFTVKDYVYNNVGQLAKESLPYFSTGLNKTSPTNDSTLYINYSYDAMGRMVTLTNAVGNTSNTYNNWKFTTTDANGKSKDLYKDAYGNVLQVDEHNAGNTYSTFYSYNYLGNVIKITDALNNVRTFTYNGLGQRLIAQDLHAPTDTSFGIWNYTYDDSGNIIQVVNPNNQIINYTHDDLHRQLTEDYLGQEGIEVTNSYDNGIDGKGRLTGVVSSSVIQNNTYNALGFLKTESKIIDSVTYPTTYDYDRQGSQTMITNPDNSQVKNIYNSAGLLDKTQRKESSDANFIDVVSNFDYSPIGQITIQQNANGTVTTNIYDATKLYRLINKKTTTSATPPAPPSPPGPVSYSSSDINSFVDIKISQNRLSDLITNIKNGVLGFASNFTSAVKSFFTVPVAMAVSPPIISTFIRDPTSILYDQSSRLSWTLSGGAPTSLSIDKSVGSVLGTSAVRVYHILDTTTYTLTAKNSAGTVTKKVTVTVNHKPPIISTFKADTTTINYGDSVRLSWTLSGEAPTSLSIDNGVGSVLGISAIRVYNVTKTTTYILTAKNSYGTVTKSVKVTVNPQAPVINTFSASPIAITSGQSVTLAWTLSGGVPTTLSINNSVGSVLGMSSKSVSPTITTTYIMTAKNISGTSYNAVLVTVNPAAPIISTFVASPTTINAGQAAILSWTLSGGAPTSLSINNSVGSVLGISSLRIYNILNTTTYTLTASNTTGFVTKSVTVIVTLPQAEAPTISPNGGTFTSAQTITLESATTGADIYYATDDSTPTAASTKYTTPFTLEQTATVKAIAQKSGYTDSTISSAIFTINIPPTSIWSGQIIQDVSYTYDAVGNITKIVDNSNTNTKKVSTYTYDDLYRVTNATVIGSDDSTKNYQESYVYDAIGNIVTKTETIGAGTPTTSVYSYSNVDYANPHAVTSIGATAFSYDNNGNMLSSTGGFTNVWDYSNRLTSAIKGTITNTYGYDAGGQRIKVASPTVTTIYPTKFYNTDGTNIVKHIFAGSQDLSTVQDTGASAKIYTNHSDLLNSSSVMTDSAGVPAEVMDYMPFGAIRIDEKVGSFNEQRKYIGQEFDAETGLNYLNARYYNSALGRFISQDPMFWNLSNELLTDPQQQNSYSYARNNPIVGSDPTGLLVELMSRQVFDAKGRDVGIHTFFKVTPDYPNDIRIDGLASGTKEFTFGAYPSSSDGWTNKLSKQIGTTENSQDKQWAFEGGKIINQTIVSLPEGVKNDTDFINNMGKAYNNMDLSEMNYFWHGNVSGLYDGNSNNFTYTLGVKSGAKSQMDSFDPGPGIAKIVGEYGYGKTLPTTSIYHTARDMAYYMGNKIGQFVSSLKAKKK